MPTVKESCRDTYNAVYNAEIARLIQEKLYDIGLADTTEIVQLADGINRDYLIEYFGTPLGQIITFLANLLTGNFNFAF